ncbi:XTP/dITP diphosphatase, partial [Candidatus Aerophobetes bacterium]|nr:XTP/dITP diphosphatase [Candidatus Aerophobetes bacterium]
MEIVLATRNSDKIREIKDAFKGTGFKFLTFSDFPSFPSPEEKGKTLRENALIKAEEVAGFTGKIALADDSGLEVDALGGAPGVYSSRFAGENASYEDNNRKLLSLLKGIPEEKRGATFRCVIALAKPDKKKITVEGVCRGRITEHPRGEGGFGYDPVFIPEGYSRTFAEISLEEKNRISHRARALRKAREVLEEFCRVKDKFLIGLTGNMGCGKSTVANFFEKWGFKVIRADQVGHLLLDEEKVKEELVRVFGEDILNKDKVSRKDLRRKVCGSEEKITLLNNILHPLIKEKIWQEIKDEKIAVIEAALIFETGWDFFMRKIIT